MQRFNFSSLLFKKPKLLTLDEKYDEAKRQLTFWLDDAFGDVGVDWNNYFIDIENEPTPGEERSRNFRAYVFLGDHRYSISGHISENREGYLGCICSSIRYRTGENWTRGNDLADGKFNKETFDKIIRDILRMEFKKLETHSGKVEMVGNRPEAAEGGVGHVQGR